MVVDGNKAYDILRQYAEELNESSHKFKFWEMISELGMHERVSAHYAELENDLAEKEVKFDTLRKICTLQKQETDEIYTILDRLMDEYDKLELIKLWMEDMGYVPNFLGLFKK